MNAAVLLVTNIRVAILKNILSPFIGILLPPVVASVAANYIFTRTVRDEVSVTDFRLHATL